MKSSLLLFVLAITFSQTQINAAEEIRCSIEEATFAKSMMDMGTGRKLPPQDLWELEETYMKTSLCAGLISKADYCLIQNKKLEDRKMFVYLLFRTGDIPTASVNRFLMARVRLRELCDKQP